MCCKQRFHAFASGTLIDGVQAQPTSTLDGNVWMVVLPNTAQRFSPSGSMRSTLLCGNETRFVGLIKKGSPISSPSPTPSVRSCARIFPLAIFVALFLAPGDEFVG